MNLSFLKSTHAEKQGILYSLLAMLTFSLADGVWKYCQHTTPNAVLFCLTFAANAVCILLWALWKKMSLRLVNGRHVFIYGALFMTEQGLFVYALGHMPLSDLFVIVLTTPLAVLIGARFLLREHLGWLQTLSLFSGFGGALAVLISHAAMPVSQAVPGLALFCALANVLFGSAKVLFLRRYCKGENVFGMGVWGSIALTAVSGAVAGPDLARVSTAAFGLLVTAGALSAIGSIGYLRAFQLCRAPLVSATQYSQMIWATLLGTLVFAEPLPLATLAGIGLICLSGILLFGGNFIRSETRG